MPTLEELRESLEKYQKAYYETRDVIYEFELNIKKEEFGEDFYCSKCRYNCITKSNVWDDIFCMKELQPDVACNKYEPNNKLSEYIADKHNNCYYNEWCRIAVLLCDNDDAGVDILLDNDSLFDKAIIIHKILHGEVGFY